MTSKIVNKKCCRNTDCAQRNLEATFIAEMSESETEKSMIDWEAFGRWMRARREGKGLSQEAAAETVRMHPQTWYRLEGGASTKHSTMLRVARFLASDDGDLNHMLVAIGFAPMPISPKSHPYDTIESVLDAAAFFEHKGLSELDKERLRPSLEMLDQEIKRLQEMRASQKAPQQPEPDPRPTPPLPTAKTTPLILPTGFEIQDRYRSRSISPTRKEVKKT